MRFIGAFGYERTNDITSLVAVALHRPRHAARYDCARWECRPKQRRSESRGNHINSIMYDRSVPLERNTALPIIITIVNMHSSGGGDGDGADQRSEPKENPKSETSTQDKHHQQQRFGFIVSTIFINYRWIKIEIMCSINFQIVCRREPKPNERTTDHFVYFCIYLQCRTECLPENGQNKQLWIIWRNNHV